ncbi:long-chain fatty acid--CoA ligase [Cytobacillus depressus]|uniref:Long-chain fatty acid--CoA ligase n=1 Tax=Cytobacillus depressus TaxID=1602942 RepID=A0A6L3VA86_9BACI|nr:long-chain fatty acid--CoA ligase [Cytobacillus depressus]KAB2338591.1 long-chain fatty acid--CoA ligase [Cytobacillus depressus]
MARPWLKHVPEGNPKEIDIPVISVPQLFAESVHKYSNHTAITFFNDTYSYKQLDSMIKNVARSLFNLGVNKGDRVALMLPNCPQYPISYYAALICGATVVQINPMYKSNELLHVINDSEAEVLIVLDQLLPAVEEIKGSTFLTTIIPVSFESGCKFNDLLKDHGLPMPNVSINPKEDIAVLQYTGGTTGRSKGAMLTHYNLVANILQSYGTSQCRTKLGYERVLTISPLFHVYGMTSCMNLTFYIGGNVILVPRFEVEQTVKVIAQTKPTIFPGVPTMYIALLNYYKENPFNLSCLRTCTSGSAPLPIEVLNQFNETSGTKVAEGFGLSEASPVTHRNPIKGLQKPGSIGIPIPNTDAKIVDLLTGDKTLPIGEVGELVVSGPQIMKGYWKMPEETKQVLRDGWLYTGDLAKMDEDGFFYIVGRKKEMIIASGYNVYPIEVEDVIYTHPKVFEAAVIGVPDQYRSETVKAVVVLKGNEQLSEEELIQFCRERLAAYKVPRFIEFVSELPKTAVGKISKRMLKEQLHL